MADPAVEQVSPLIRGAGATYVALGSAFGIGALVTLDHNARHGELPMTPWGFRAFAGPFERLTPAQFTALLRAVVVVSALDVLAGIWLWQGRRRGAALGLATEPAALFLGSGFALPFLLAGIPIRIALTLAGRRRLR